MKIEQTSKIEPTVIELILKQQKNLPYDYIRNIERNSLVDYFTNDIISHSGREDTIQFICKEHNSPIGFLLIQKLKWDSEIFGFLCARIKYLFSVEDQNSTLIKNSLVREAVIYSQSENIKFIDCHLHPLDLSGIKSLVKNNFDLIATHIHHVWDFRQNFALNYKPTSYIKFANPNDLPLLESISKDIIPIHNRFNLDENIRRTGRIPILFREWLKNSLLGRAKCVLLAIEEDKVVGYTTVVVKEETKNTLGITIADVELTGVVPDTRNKGVYRDMIITAVEWARKNKIDIMEGVIHACNAPANVVPPQLNARVLGAHHTFHWHAN
ncbi:MAG: GNAT family N-acetyltransferase [Candidatus Hydrogenedentes bacterium]|nr:GNAT family N-acetyltransferase [Candidatus Hydrogenedentota bacterium]